MSVLNRKTMSHIWESYPIFALNFQYFPLLVLAWIYNTYNFKHFISKLSLWLHNHNIFNFFNWFNNLKKLSFSFCTNIICEIYLKLGESASTSLKSIQAMIKHFINNYLNNKNIRLHKRYTLIYYFFNFLKKSHFIWKIKIIEVESINFSVLVTFEFHKLYF